MEDYDIGKSFEKIENEIIQSMIRNFDHHRAEELKEGYNWEMWQVKQLEALEKFKKENAIRYNKQFKDINAQIKELIKQARTDGSMEQEIAILRAIKGGLKAKKISNELSAEFFKVNDRKMDTLIKATINDIQTAEKAILRMSNDKYRKIIFDAQAYATSGAGTYAAAVDMATRDFLRAGINCIEYKNGSRHTVKEYSRMAVQTASKRAYLTGEGEKRQEWGEHLVIMNKRLSPCHKCLVWVGKILIDDVWSGGSQADGNYPLMSTAIKAGLYH